MTAIERLRSGCRLEADIIEVIAQHKVLADALEAIAVLRWPALTSALTEMSEAVEREAGAALRAAGRLP